MCFCSVGGAQDPPIPDVVLTAASSSSFKIEPPPPNSASPSFIASLKPASSTFLDVRLVLIRTRPGARRHTFYLATCTRASSAIFFPYFGHALRLELGLGHYCFWQVVGSYCSHCRGRALVWLWREGERRAREREEDPHLATGANMAALFALWDLSSGKSSLKLAFAAELGVTLSSTDAIERLADARATQAAAVHSYPAAVVAARCF